MFIDFLLEVFAAGRTADALVWRERRYSYEELLAGVSRWRDELPRLGIPKNATVALEADYSPTAVYVLLALIDRGCTVVPLTASVEAKKPEFRRIAEVEHVLQVDAADQVTTSDTGAVVTHPLLLGLRSAGHPGLIVFSSGSTGTSKAALHDFVPLLDKFRTRRPGRRMLSFLLFDHMGGLNTLLHTLANGGCLVTPGERTPDAVARAIEQHRVEVLPTSPTFLNLLLLTEAHRRHDLSSLEVITYGTEPMPESTLRHVHEAFPQVKLQQTYGLSELGVMRSKSKASDSLWVKVGGEGYETRVVDGLLEIRAKSMMLGYLNAPSPFTADGWFKTGDEVEVDGEYFRILGRRSEMINVGGEKVFPAEVESVVAEMEEVEDVVVSGEPNPFMGQIVRATVVLKPGTPADDFKRRLHAFCRPRLQQFKIPQRVVIQAEPLHSDRFKKLRASF